ncbi:PGF-CTERM sorting domain-containing protein [Haladaptatus cibarius]|uniref:PGF-CTERM sorting domain-containing protein n=1 Tax=Haladaptatus cibarius TaxID=453847 RepID=UPI000678AB21|nr:PGF-CTERM sorting domain-containing protein [Haladaptatus cibarius]
MARTATLVFVLSVVISAGAIALPGGAIELQAEPEPTERWNQTYGGSGDDIFNDAARTEDGGYILVGEIENSGTGIDGWVVKIDGEGEQEWERTLSGPGTDRFYSVVTNDDGSAMVAGRTDSGGTATGWVVELGTNGETQNERTPGTGAFYGLERDGNGYVLAGWTSDGGTKGWLLKLDGSGERAWEETYAAPSDYSSGQFKGIVPASNGYFVAGEVEGGSQDAWAMRVGNDGERRWQKTAGGSDREAIWAATGGDEGIVLSGESESGDSRDGWVLKYDANGELVWENRYGGNDVDWLDSAMQTDDGSYLFTGGTLTGGIGSADGYVVKTGSDGTVQWESAYGSAQWDKPFPAVNAHGGGYLLAGQTGGFGAKGMDGWVLRLGSDGQVSESSGTTDGDDADGSKASETAEANDSASTAQSGGEQIGTSLPGFTGIVAIVAVALSILLWRRRE